MKTRYTFAAALASLAFAISGAALHAESEKPSGKSDRPPARQSAGQQLEHLKTELNLTDDQSTKIKAILADEAAAVRTIRQDESLDNKAKREKMQEVRKSGREKIEAVLTAEQKAAFEKLASERRGPKKEKKPKD
ncbi:hypothetical protein OpiT1DRAFT_03734 [Opitutaceae bacterium TAV1]|nr:hypothetical protein OpiT1DRAFT_03734 [Opitutaceae bacterium TAV1]